MNQAQVHIISGLGANGENLQNWMPLINAGINAGTTIATTAINAKNQNASTTGTVVTGGSTGTYAPTGGTSYTPPTTTQKTDYTPWIIGGVALLGLFGFMMMSNNSKGRR